MQGWSQTLYVYENDLKLLSLLFLPSESWITGMHYPARFMQCRGIEPRALWEIVIVIPSTNRVSIPVHSSQVASSNHIRLSTWTGNYKGPNSVWNESITEAVSTLHFGFSREAKTWAPKGKPLPPQWLIWALEICKRLWNGRYVESGCSGLDN